MTPDYMAEPWFGVLQAACSGRKQSQVALRLGLSKGAISQVLNGTGLYGQGVVSTAHIAQRVMHVFDRFPCPHLSSESVEGEVVITSAQCRAWAHRPPPTSSPREIQHWQACQHCPHKQMSMALGVAAPASASKAHPTSRPQPTTKEPQP